MTSDLMQAGSIQQIDEGVMRDGVKGRLIHDIDYDQSGFRIKEIWFHPYSGALPEKIK